MTTTITIGVARATILFMFLFNMTKREKFITLIPFGENRGFILYKCFQIFSRSGVGDRTVPEHLVVRIDVILSTKAFISFNLEFCPFPAFVFYSDPVSYPTDSGLRSIEGQSLNSAINPSR